MKKSLFLLLTFILTAFAQEVSALVTVTQKDASLLEVKCPDAAPLLLDFYGPNIIRLFQDPQGGALRNPEATPAAEILVPQPRRSVGTLEVSEQGQNYVVTTSRVRLYIDKEMGLLTFQNRATGRNVVRQVAPVLFEEDRTSIKLSTLPEEGFYGGGVQNGRFAHRGKSIAIVNTNNWTDGGVASPTPFYWSTAGYGLFWHTFAPGHYDFGANSKKEVNLMHEVPYLDLFLMVDEGAVALLKDFYQLTGNPVLLPKFGFYEGHLNAYNRGYWEEIKEQKAEKEWSMVGPQGSVLFEDGKYYKESQKPVEGGIRESLNGELEGNYQFSARAALDRYVNADMPLGWFLPNDGYGAGYGQTGTLEGNVENLRLFGEYARSKGVEIGLWTQSDLHPKEGVEALLQRDIVREVRDAGVRVLKTDVAWVGAGYSFGLNGVADVAEIMPREGNHARPFIISLDGWAGTQRYAGIWTGDQTGGEWEYIRFHLPTYIGSGLSGQPNICSDMDGIFGGRNVPVNVRDYQWKTFSPMQLNMDGWGSNAKYPQALGEPAASINRWYLKLKSMLMPYTYSIAHEAISGKPMIRPMFMETPEGLTRGDGKASTLDYTRSVTLEAPYQFMYGPSILVAPIYQNTAADSIGNDIRNGIFLPAGQWVDFFSGQVYEGGRIINGFEAPLWKLPVFVRRGSIIPIIHAHNNPNQVDSRTRAFMFCPKGHTEFTLYDDDGTTDAYLRGASATTLITSQLDTLNVKKMNTRLTLTVEPTQGRFKGFEPMKSTEFVINLSQRPKKVMLLVNGKKVQLDEAQSKQDFAENTNVYYYDEAPELNLWPTPNSKMAHLSVTQAPCLYVCASDIDISKTQLQVIVEGYQLDVANPMTRQLPNARRATIAPHGFRTQPTAYTLEASWQPQEGADYYELRLNEGIVLSNIRGTSFTIEGLQPESTYRPALRSVNNAGCSPWASIEGTEVTTLSDPLRHAIRGISGETTCENQPGQALAHLFDFDEGTVWHTAWSQQATPFDLVMDLHSVNILEELHYLPRPDAGNGTLLRGSFSYSMDRQTWTEAGAFEWAADGETKVFGFNAHPQARYVKMHVEEGRGGYGSGQQIYVFRVEGSEWYIPGDINQDGRLDENDFTSYMNYTGLRQGDGDFEGYVSRGDLNGNGLIDAYDISAVGIELESGVSSVAVAPLAGEIAVKASKQTANAGDMVTLTVRGKGLQSVNALSFALPYDASQWEYVGIQPTGMKEARNMTYDRLHTNGQKALYPTFVNCGEHPYFDDGILMTIQFRAKQRGKVNLTPQDGFIVDKKLNAKTW